MRNVTRRRVKMAAKTRPSRLEIARMVAASLSRGVLPTVQISEGGGGALASVGERRSLGGQRAQRDLAIKRADAISSAVAGSDAAKRLPSASRRKSSTGTSACKDVRL